MEIPFEDIGDSIDRAYRDIATKVKIKGFRKGKAPKAVIDQMIGKEAVFHEALHEIIPAFYPEAIESSGIDPISSPEIDVVQAIDGKPLIFKAKVEVKPEVKIADISKIEIEDQPKKSVSGEVKERLEKLRDKFSTLELVKGRAAKKQDFVLMDFDGFIDGKPFEGGQATDYMLELGSGDFIPGFEDQLEGAKAKSEKEVKVTFPKDYQSEFLAGKDAVFSVKVKEIKSKKKPKVDDEFAKNVSKFEDLKELKKDLKREATERIEKERENFIRNSAVDALAAESGPELPAAMLEQRIDQMVGDFKERMAKGGGSADFSAIMPEGSEELAGLRKNFQTDAERTLKSELVLGALMDKENIEATDEDIEEEIMRLAEGSKRNLDDLRAEIDGMDGRKFLKSRLSMNKTVDFLVSKVKIKKKDDAHDSGTDSN